jgi:putative NADH-flavin reductase
MKALFIGGTGIISTACTKLAVERGIELTLLTRGQHAARPHPDIRTITADIGDEAAVARALQGQTFDVAVDWIAYGPETRSA